MSDANFSYLTATSSNAVAIQASRPVEEGRSLTWIKGASIWEKALHPHRRPIRPSGSRYLPMQKRCLYPRMKRCPSDTAIDAITFSPIGFVASTSNLGSALNTKASPP